MVQSPLKAAQEAGVFGKVIGAEPEKLAQLGEDVAVIALDESAVSCGAGVSACAAIAMGVGPCFRVGTRVIGAGLGRFREKGEH